MALDFFNSSCRKLCLTSLIFSSLVVHSSSCSRSDNNSPERAAINGQIKFKGEAVEDGMITFTPLSPTVGPSTGAKISKGAYSISQESGPVVGMNRVEITAYQKTGKRIEAGTPNPPGTMVDELNQIIPKEYNAQSIISIQINTGNNENKDFDLVKK